jgi:hypothetical protein
MFCCSCKVSQSLWMRQGQKEDLCQEGALDGWGNSIVPCRGAEVCIKMKSKWL